MSSHAKILGAKFCSWVQILSIDIWQSLFLLGLLWSGLDSKCQSNLLPAAQICRMMTPSKHDIRFLSMLTWLVNLVTMKIEFVFLKCQTSKFHFWPNEWNFLPSPIPPNPILLDKLIHQKGIKGWGWGGGSLPSKYNHDEFVIHLARYTFRPGDCNFHQETQNTAPLSPQLKKNGEIISDLELEYIR